MAVSSRVQARPRITHVVRQFWPQQGGLEESVRQLCASLRQTYDADVDVVTLDRTFSDQAVHTAHDTVDGIPVRRIPYHGSHRYPVAPEFLAATAGADVLHVHAIDFFFDALAITRPFRGTPMVASTHGGFFHTNFARKLKLLYFDTVTRAACRAYDIVGASSVADAERFRPIAGNRVEVIENGVDIDKWANAASPTPVQTMISIGRWSSNKNMAALFSLLRELRRASPEWRLLIAGSAHDVSRADLDGWAAAAGVAGAVEIHDAPSTTALHQLIGRASFLVSLSSYEGFGISVVEGLSAGLVPILSDIANYRLFVERAGVGTIVPADPVDAAARVLALDAAVAADHPRQRQQAIAAASRYDWPAVAERWHGHYAAILARRQSRAAHAAA
jgi:alpha-1,3-mannosyltransferase